MQRTDFGGHTLSYRVIPVENGWIHLEVHHKNHDIRRQIEKHLDDPRWFLRYLTVDDSGIIAIKHLKEVVSQFQDHFREGHVSVILVEDREQSLTKADAAARRRPLGTDGTLRLRKEQSLTKKVTDYLLEKLLPEFSECWIGSERACPKGLSYLFGPEVHYRRLPLRRANQVWKWSLDNGLRVKDCLDHGICSDITQHLEESQKFYKEQPSQRGERFRPDITIYCPKLPSIMFIHFEVNRMNPWENLRLMWAFAQRYPQLKIRFLQWLNQYNNPEFQFHRQYKLARVLGEASGWAPNFCYQPVILAKVYAKDNPCIEDVYEICQHLIKEAKVFMSS